MRAKASDRRPLFYPTARKVAHSTAILFERPNRILPQIFDFCRSQHAPSSRRAGLFFRKHAQKIIARCCRVADRRLSEKNSLLGEPKVIRVVSLKEFLSTICMATFLSRTFLFKWRLRGRVCGGGRGDLLAPSSQVAALGQNSLGQCVIGCNSRVSGTSGPRFLLEHRVR